MGHLLMSTKERDLKALLEMVKQKKLTLNKVATQIEMSYRQIKRIYKHYRAKGDAGLIHKARGRASNRTNPHRAIIIARYQTRYEDFGPTLAAEKLLEDGYPVDHETLRRWLLAENIWSKKRKRSPYRQRRERRAQFGELVQVDGSIHDWFEEGELKCLLNMVDDATGKTLSLMAAGETTEIVFRTLWAWIKAYGIPLALYVDLKNVYVAPKEDNWSHVETACDKLGIKIIKAYSPQAKGRVERNHGVYQDRFVKELRLKSIKTIEGANVLLGGGFIDDLNKKFEKVPRNPESAHRSAEGIDLNRMLCWIYKRQLQNDWTFSFQGQYYQVEKCHETLRPKIDLCIRRHLGGAITAEHQNKLLSITPLSEKPINQKVKKLVNKNALSRSMCGKLGKKNSPWSHFNPDWLHRNKHVKKERVEVTEFG